MLLSSAPAGRACILLIRHRLVLPPTGGVHLLVQRQAPDPTGRASHAPLSYRSTTGRVPSNKMHRGFRTRRSRRFSSALVARRTMTYRSESWEDSTLSSYRSLLM